MNKILKSASTILLSLALTSCAQMFQGKVDMDTTSKIATLADLVREENSMDNLSTPSQLFVSQGDSASTIKISWTPVNGAQSYRLERAIVKTKNSSGAFDPPSEADFQIISGSFGNTAFIYGKTFYEDEILSSPGSTNEEYDFYYFYRVSAENLFIGYGSSEFTEPVGGTLFAPPTSVVATAGSYKDKVVVSWKKTTSKSATSYTIYRSQNSDGSNSTRLASVKSNMTSYTDKIGESNRGTEYYYTVSAENSIGESSANSSLAMGYARADGAPEQVTDVHVTDGRGFDSESISIAWTGDSETHYTVYRSSSRDSALTMLVADLNMGSSAYTYKDANNLSPNLYYYYMVQPWKKMDDGTQIKGPLSESSASSANPAEGYLLSAPQTISVTKKTNIHSITWSKAIGAPDEQEKYSYTILGSNTMDSGFIEIATLSSSSLISYGDEYNYEITQPYSYYRIKTKNEQDNYSLDSETVAPAPYAPQNAYATRYANLSTEMGSSWRGNVNGVCPVKITWSAPNESSDIAGYYVYRSEKKDKGWKKLSIGNDEKSFLITGTTFYDINEGARTKKIYYYKVVSVNSLGNGNNFSNIEFGYGALTSDQYMKEYNIMILNSQKKLTLMHKSGNTDKLGTENAAGDLSGNLYYNAGISGVSGRVIMQYTDYADYYVHSNGKIDSTPLDSTDDVIGNANGIYFIDNGNTNTSAGIDTNGTMDGTVVCKGMYPGTVCYDKIQIKSGAAGGGYYIITRENFEPENVNWTVANEK